MKDGKLIAYMVQGCGCGTVLVEQATIRVDDHSEWHSCSWLEIWPAAEVAEDP